VKILEPLVKEGNITVPYQWTTGPAVGKFLTELRDNKKIMGLRCPKCKRLFVPPLELFCGRCFVEMKDWVEVSEEGKVISYTVVNLPLPEPCQPPLPPPYALAAIRLEGADTEIIHLLGEVEFEKIKIGMPVKAVWKEKREGSILDIEHFKPRG